MKSSSLRTSFLETESITQASKEGTQATVLANYDAYVLQQYYDIINRRVE